MNCVRCGDQLILNLPLCLRCGEPIVAPEKSPRQKPETQSKDSPAQSNSQSTKEVGGKKAESTSSKAAGQQADTQKHKKANSPLFPWKVIASLTFLYILLILALSAPNPSIPDPPVESDHSNNGVATISSASSAESARETLDSSNQETKLNTALEDRKSKLVRDVQDKLTQHLFNPGPIDGIAGQKTRAAITDFQRENNLAISGSVDEELLVRLEGSLIKHQELNGGLTWTSEQESRFQELADLNDEFLEVEARAADPLAQYELGLRLVEKREYERAGSWFEMPAASGLLQAKNELGKLHSGSLFESDPTYAYQLFMDAAAGGYLLAINNVGLCLEFGIGIEANPLAAVEWYRHAAIQGTPVAVLNLARLYKSGSSVDKDVNHAIALLEKVKKTDPSNADASLELGKIYMFNADGLRNTAKAKTWLADAADLRNVEAMELLGDLTCGTNAINPDCVEGYRWYHAAANEGNSNSMVMVGMMYAAGQGVEKDFTAAYFWFNQSASQGNALADILAGGFQAEGIGVEKDELTARDRFYRVYNSETATSFEKGFAMGALGMLYFGENSSIRNVQEAAKAFEIAAEHGYSSAIMMLGIMYADGIVFEKDEAKAIMLLEKAASLGDQTTITLLATAYEEGEGFIQKDPEKAKFYRNQLADIHAQGWLHQAGSLFLSD